MFCFRLCINCKDDPFADDETFRNPAKVYQNEEGDRAATTIRDVISFLLHNITQIALPSVMVRSNNIEYDGLILPFVTVHETYTVIRYILQGNNCHLTDGTLLFCLLQSLNNLHHLSLPEMTSFYSYLSKIGFLGDVFTIQSKFW